MSGTIDFLIRVHVYRNPLLGERPNKQNFINNVTAPST